MGDGATVVRRGRLAYAPVISSLRTHQSSCGFYGMISSKTIRIPDRSYKWTRSRWESGLVASRLRLSKQGERRLLRFGEGG